MVRSTALLLTLFLFCSCGNNADETTSAPAEVQTPAEPTYPAAVKQSDGTILLYTKVSATGVLSEYIIPAGDPLHTDLSQQLKDAPIGRRTPVDISAYQ